MCLEPRMVLNHKCGVAWCAPTQVTQAAVDLNPFSKWTEVKLPRTFQLFRWDITKISQWQWQSKWRRGLLPQLSGRLGMLSVFPGGSNLKSMDHMCPGIAMVQPNTKSWTLKTVWGFVVVVVLQVFSLQLTYAVLTCELSRWQCVITISKDCTFLQALNVIPRTEGK